MIFDDQVLPIGYRYAYLVAPLVASIRIGGVRYGYLVKATNTVGTISPLLGSMLAENVLVRFTAAIFTGGHFPYGYAVLPDH